MAFFALLSCVLVIGAYGQEQEEYEYEPEEYEISECEDGLLLPLWRRDSAGRGVVYPFALLYFLLGIFVFMSKLIESLETVTSLMKRKTVADAETGTTTVIIERVFSKNLANILLLLGSSFPLIFLCIVECLGRGFMSGDLGPSTLLGSSAFNTFVVIGIIVSTSGQVKKVKNVWGLLAAMIGLKLVCVWLTATMSLISYGQIDIWEATVTIILCIIIIIAVLIIIGISKYFNYSRICNMFSYKRKHRTEEYEENFEHYQLLMTKFEAKYPELTEKELIEKVSECGTCRRPKSWAYYMVKITNKIAGRTDPEATKMEGINIQEGPTFESEKQMKDNIDKVIMRANNGGLFKKEIWLQQFSDLFNFKHLGGVGPVNCIIHVITWPWKFLSAFTPPASFMGGYPSLVMACLAIFVITAFICDFFMQMTCFFQVKVFILGFTLLAILLNIPTLGAAVLAAAEEKTADLPLMSLILGNCISLSLGFALPWLMSSKYWESYGRAFEVVPYSVAFCCDLLLSMSFVAFLILLGRRTSCCGGGELGGNIVCKIITTVIFFILWLGLIALVALENHGMIDLGY